MTPQHDLCQTQNTVKAMHFEVFCLRLHALFHTRRDIEVHTYTHTYTHNEGDGALVWHNLWVNPDGGIICTHTHICELFGQRANTYTHWVLSNTYETISGGWKSKAICCLRFTRIPRWRKLHWPEGFPKIPHDADEDRRDGDGYQLHHLPISTLPLLLDACLAQAVGFQHHAPDILPLAGSQTSGSARPW